MTGRLAILAGNVVELRYMMLYCAEQGSKRRGGRYDEMPKSATMENRQNLLEQQV